MEQGMLDNYVLPDGAYEQIKKSGLRTKQIGSGVSCSMNGHVDGVAFKFFLQPIYNRRKSDDAGYEVFDEIECVQFFVDAKTKPVKQIWELKPEQLRFDREGNVVGGSMAEAYKRFKKGAKTPGLSLARWNVLSVSAVATLEKMNIFTVEQFAEVPDNKIAGKLPSVFIEAHKRAKQWVAGKDMVKTSNQQAAEMARLARENEDLKKRLDTLEKTNAIINKVRSREKKEE